MIETGALRINARISIPKNELRLSFSRSSGPGGQNVNKLNTRASLRWNVQHSTALSDGDRVRIQQRLERELNADGDLLVVSQRYRTQGRNIVDCYEKLRWKLLEALRVPKIRRPTETPRRAHRKRLENKRQQAEKKRRRSNRDW